MWKLDRAIGTEFPQSGNIRDSYSQAYLDVTDKIERLSTFIGRSLWVNRRPWPRKAIGHRVLPSIFRSFTIRPRLPLKTFVGDVIVSLISCARSVSLFFNSRSHA